MLHKNCMYAYKDFFCLIRKLSFCHVTKVVRVVRILMITSSFLLGWKSYKSRDLVINFSWWVQSLFFGRWKLPTFGLIYCKIWVSIQSPQKLMGLRTLIPKLMGSVEPIEPPPKRPLKSQMMREFHIIKSTKIAWLNSGIKRHTVKHDCNTKEVLALGCLWLQRFSLATDSQSIERILNKIPKIKRF